MEKQVETRLKGLKQFDYYFIIFIFFFIFIIIVLSFSLAFLELGMVLPGI